MQNAELKQTLDNKEGDILRKEPDESNLNGFRFLKGKCEQLKVKCKKAIDGYFPATAGSNWKRSTEIERRRAPFSCFVPSCI